MDSIEGKVIIAGILEGGIIHQHGMSVCVFISFYLSQFWWIEFVITDCSGGLQVGDQIVLVNNVEIDGTDLNAAIDHIERLMDDDSSVIRQYIYTQQALN